jgi:hypothetical protein
VSARFEIKSERVGNKTSVAVSGIIDEGAELALFGDLHGDVVVDLAGIKRINSYGVRLWVDAMRHVPADATVVFVRCAPPMVEQMNMIHGFFADAEVRSFYAPMICPECEEQEYELFEVEPCRAAGGKLPEVKCPACSETMEVDDIEEQFLFFLRLEPEDM